MAVELDARRRPSAAAPALSLCGQELHPADRLEQRLAADREPVRVARRDELAVVRELALDQAGRQPRVADLERRLALAEAQRDLARATEERARSSFSARDGTRTFWPSAQHVLAVRRSRTASR